MRINSCIKLWLTLLCCVFLGGIDKPANAGCTLFDWSDCIDNTVGQITHVSVTFHNNTDSAYWVVMDTDRESYVIAAGGSATFRQARIGDNPTFHIRNPNTQQELDSWTIGVLTGNMDLNYGD